MRAVTPTLLLAALLACGGEGGPPSTQPVTPASPVVTSVLIAPPAGPIEAGASLALVATVRDQNGNTIAGKTLAWATSDANVATVQSTGTVTGIAAGIAIVSASVEGRTGSTQVTVVATPVASVTLSAPTEPVVAGQPAAMVIAVADRNGNALAGRRITWSSSNTVVATVDVNGRLTALSPGTTTITALCEGITATAAVVVTAPAGSAPPTIASISPATLTPGAIATITGANFVALGANAVTVAGVPVTVNAATATELSITVPAAGMPCQSTQPVAVSISSVGGSATTKHPLAVAKSRPMSVGDSFIVGASEDIACNELPAGASYLVSVFNGSNTPTITARFDFRGSSGGAVASIAPATEVPRASVDVSTGERPRAVGSAAQEEHLLRLGSDAALLERIGPPRRSRGASFSRSGSGVPVPLFVGSTTTMKYHYSSCSATGFSNVTARVVYVGPNAVVLEDVAGPLAGSIDADLIALAQEFETRSFPLLLNFGDPLAWDAQTDQNGRIVILFTPKVNSQSQNLLGFVAACDLYAPSQDPSVAASNQAEIFYARTVTDTSPTSTTLNGRSQWKRQMPATLIHEAKHITSYAERISRAAPQFEQVWLEEATAQIASEMYGRVIHGNGWRSDAPYNPTLWCEARPTTPECGGGVIAMGNHFAFLTNYLQNFEAKSMLGGTDDNDIYGSSWLFVRWVLDTYGGSSERDFLRGLVQSASRTGTANVEEVSGKPFARLLAEFTLMLAADNLPGVRAPFVMPSWNLPDVFAGYAELGTLPPAPLAMRQSTGGSFAVSGRNLRGGGAVLLRLGPGAPGATQLLDLRSTATTPLSTGSSIGLAVLRID